MKKIISVFIALIMMLSTMCVCAIPAFASEQWEPRPYAQDTLGCVNGEPGEIHSDYDASLKEFTFSYDGEGTVTDWELPLLKEGKDFEIVSKEANKFTIKKLDDEISIPYVNAEVDFQQNVSDPAYNSSADSDLSDSSNKNETADESVSKDTNSSDTVNADEPLAEKAQNSDKWISKDIALICVAVIVVAGASLIVIKKKKSNV